MSHLICQIKDCSNISKKAVQPNFYRQQRHTVKDDHTKIIKIQSPEQLRQGRTQQQNQLIRTCRKLTYRQLDKFHRSSVKDLKIQFSKLKTQLRVSGKYKQKQNRLFRQFQTVKILQENDQGSEATIIRKIYKKSNFQQNKNDQYHKNDKNHATYFAVDANKDNSKDLAKFLGKSTQKLGQRFAKKLEVLKQIQEIQKQKSSFNIWKDKSYNNPVTSPIYNHMVYVFEKIRKNNFQTSFTDFNQCLTLKNQQLQAKYRQNLQLNRINKGENTQKRIPFFLRQNVKTVQNSPQKRKKLHKKLISDSLKSEKNYIENSFQQNALISGLKYRKKIKKSFNLRNIDAYRSLM